jgi:anti-anti-sigma regulatory factor
MTITSTHVGGSLALRVAGRLDAVRSPEFQKTCRQCISFPVYDSMEGALEPL